MKKNQTFYKNRIFIYKQHIMSETILLVSIFFVFIIVMTLILNKVEKDRIPLMGDFFKKVLPSIPVSKIFSKGKNKKTE